MTFPPGQDEGSDQLSNEESSSGQAMLPTYTKDVNRRAGNKILMSSVLAEQKIYNDTETKGNMFIYIVKFGETSSTSF